jgi:hypothetical protein
MPQVRKLAPEEVQTIQNKGKGTRKITEEQYDALLAGFEVGEYGEATLDEGENRLTTRNRMKAAATRRGLGINFRRTTGDLIRFQIVEHTNGNGDGIIGESASTALIEKGSAAPISSEAPPKNKGGRPRKQEKGAMDRLEEIAGKVQDAAKGALEDMGLREPAKRKGGRPKKNPAA